MTSDQASSDMRHMCVKEGFSYYAVIPERDVCGHQIWLTFNGGF